MKFILVLMVLLNVGYSNAQDFSSIDSLIEVLDHSKISKERFFAAVKLSEICDIEDIPLYHEIALKELNSGEIPLDKEILHEKASAIGNLGFYYNQIGVPDSAILCYNESIQLNTQINNLSGLASNYASLAMAYQALGHSSLTLENAFRSLKYSKKSGNSFEESYAYSIISRSYMILENYEEALKYQFKSVKIDQEIGSEEDIPIGYNNLAALYFNLGQSDSAHYYYDLALQIYLKEGNEKGLLMEYCNLGALSWDDGNKELAEKYFGKSLELMKKIKSPEWSARVYRHLSEIRNVEKNYKAGLKFAEMAYQFAYQINDVELIKDAAEMRYLNAAAIGDYKQAYLNQALYFKLRDSITGIDAQKAALQKQLNFEYQNKKIADSLDFAKQQEITKIESDSKLQKERSQRYLLYAGLAFFGVLGAAFYRNYRLKKKDNEIISAQKLEVEKQKDIIEETHNEIKDSIKYAKRIQQAILPPSHLFKSLLPQSFVLYLPKDVVAGDFYWLEKRGDAVLVAAADCTGHGVPGAMVSVVCNNALNRAVREYGLEEPDQILEKTREIVISEFEKSEEDVKDGMDVALLSINLAAKKLKYAGANNPLWIYRSATNEIEEIKADKQPIGKFEFASSFKMHTVDLNAGDTIYVFSDGFVDQFGGEKGKKFKPKPFKELLMGLQTQNIENQKELLEKAFLNWRNDFDQVDDVCVIGVRI